MHQLGSHEEPAEVLHDQIDTAYFRRCIHRLELALSEIETHGGTTDVLYDMYRETCVEAYELVLEQSGKLLRKRLAPFFASNRQADRLHFKDLFRYAAKHALMDTDTVERWFSYRDNRIDTEHNDGKGFPETTLKLLPACIDDAKCLANMLEQVDDD